MKKSIEQYGSQTNRTGVKVSAVRMGFKEGEGSISGLSIGNPKGVFVPMAFAAGNIIVAIDTGSVRKAPVIIEEVKVSGPGLDKKAVELAQNGAAREAKGTLKKLPGK